MDKDRSVATEMFEVVAESTADRERVFARLSDIDSWPTWGGPMTRTTKRIRDGKPDPNGVGAVRKAAFVHEEIVEFLPPARLSYVIIKGVPGLERYRATVELEPTERGTTIRWRGRFDPRIPGTGPLLNRFLKGAVTQLVTKLAQA